MLEILGEPYSRDDGQTVKIGAHDYSALVMESDYDEGMQVGAPEGDLVFHDLVTYGYGEVISWADLLQRQQALAAWAERTAAEHHCAWSIFVSANYW